MDTFWKGKKVVAYVALKHHIRFIIPIMEQLSKLGATTQYIVAQAERSQEITAIEAELEYYHVFEFLTDADTEDILNNYWMLKTGLGDTLLRNTVFGVIVPTVMDKTLFATAQEYIGFNNFFKTCQPDICIALHEVNRWGKMFAFHAKKHDVPCITLQEGLLTTASKENNYKFTGHVQYSTIALLWGNATKKKLIGCDLPGERLFPIGNTHLSGELSRITKKNIRTLKRKQYHSNGLVALLLPSIYLPPLAELKPIFQSFSKHKENQLFVKFHPATTKETIEKWIGPLNQKIKAAIHFFHGEENIYDLMAMSDICVLTEGSTTGLEALVMNKPVVELKLNSPVYLAFSLSDQKAAIPMTPNEFAEQIHSHKNLFSLMDKNGIETYIHNELHDPENSIKNAIDILSGVLSVKLSQGPKTMIPEVNSNLEWSIILPVIDNPELLFEILEAISLHSENETYEVILIKSENLSPTLSLLLNSLEGDISFIESKKDQPLSRAMDQAALKALGENLIFMENTLAPTAGWLSALKKGRSKFDKLNIFGARIINKYNNIVHAGMVINANCTPVSSYMYVDGNFPHSLTERSFQMVNHFICIHRDIFYEIGGFNDNAGVYAFMDICLRAGEIFCSTEIVQYLPQVKLIQVVFRALDIPRDDAIFFYSKWHSRLWETEDALYKKDGVSALQLEGARMTRVMAATETQSSLP
ncbi:MAG: hypothetical protein ABIJ59_17510 [Pseudomonadota bacterium]